MEETIEIISKVIVARYKSTNITKKELKEKTGLALNTINNALMGKNLTLSSLLRLADALGLNLRQIVEEADKMKLSFPKAGSTPMSVKTEKAHDLLTSGQSTMQIAARMGIPEEDLKVSVTGTKDNQSFEID